MWGKKVKMQCTFRMHVTERRVVCHLNSFRQLANTYTNTDQSSQLHLALKFNVCISDLNKGFKTLA